VRYLRVGDHDEYENETSFGAEGDEVPLAPKWAFAAAPCATGDWESGNHTVAHLHLPLLPLGDRYGYEWSGRLVGQVGRKLADHRNVFDDRVGRSLYVQLGDCTRMTEVPSG
jgi:hypothetical protein